MSESFDSATIDSNVGRRALSDAEQDQVRAIKAMGHAFCVYLDSLSHCRDFTLAKARTHEAVVLAVRGITHD